MRVQCVGKIYNTLMICSTRELEASYIGIWHIYCIVFQVTRNLSIGFMPRGEGKNDKNDRASNTVGNVGCRICTCDTYCL